MTSDAALIGGCLRTARAAAGAVIVAGLLVIVGYAWHVTGFIRLRHDLQGMSLVTALGILDLAAGLLAQSWMRLRAAQAAAWLAVIIGFGALLMQAVMGRDVLSAALEVALGFDRQEIALVSVASALCIGTLGLSMIMSARAAGVVADGLAVSVTLVTSFALLGYAYGLRQLYALPVFHTMALHTAACLLLLSVVALLVRPQSHWCAVVGARTETGYATRRQLSFLLFPFAAGWLLLHAIDSRAIGPAAAMALLVVITVASLAMLILRDGRRLVELESERRARFDTREALQNEMRDRLKTQEQEINLRSAQQSAAEAALFKAQRLEALSRLTGGIAHEFNNLLQAITGNMELMARRLGEGHSARPLVDAAKSATQRGAKLSGQLLAFSRTQRLDIRPTELDKVLHGAQTMLGAALGSQIALHYDLQAPQPWIKADDEQIRLALLNLALNAKDAIRGRGDITVASSVKHLALAAGDAAAVFVSVRVTDTGEGMTPQVAARALEPFFSTKPLGTASGLGLAQVYGFMRQCEGDIRITTDVGRGTSVELLFPQHAAPDVAQSIDKARAGPAQRPEPRSRRLILVIEDDDQVRQVIVKGLQGAGYDVAEAPDGAQGLELLKNSTPCAAVIDFIMPVLNGAEVARLARVTQPDLPIVFVSGHFETAALAAIPNAVILRKPFELEGLQNSLASVLH